MANPRSTAHRIIKKAIRTRAPQKQGFLTHVKNFLQKLWSTQYTLTEKLPSKSAILRTSLKELIIYLIFLTTTCILALNMTNATYFHYNSIMQKLFLDTAGPNGIKFPAVNTIEHFWSYIDENGPLLNGLYWTKWYNEENLEIDDQNRIFYENKLLGVPRLRQLRVKDGSCHIHPDFQDKVSHCFGDYTEAEKETLPYGDVSSPAFNFQSAEILKGSDHLSIYSTKIFKKYDGSGYVQDLNLTKWESKILIDDLKTSKWVDRQTRAVFVDFTVYNANANLFCTARLLFEFPASGGVRPSSEFRVVKMTEIDDENRQFMIYLEYVFLLGLAKKC